MSERQEPVSPADFLYWHGLYVEWEHTGWNADATARTGMRTRRVLTPDQYAEATREWRDRQRMRLLAAIYTDEPTGEPIRTPRAFKRADRMPRPRPCELRPRNGCGDT